MRLNKKFIRRIAILVASCALVAIMSTFAMAQANQKEVWDYLKAEPQVFDKTQRLVIPNDPPTDVQFSLDVLGLMKDWKVIKTQNSLRLGKKLATGVLPDVQFDFPLEGVRPLRVYVVKVLAQTDKGNTLELAVVRFYPKGTIRDTRVNELGSAYHEVEQPKKTLKEKGIDTLKKVPNPFGKKKP